MSRDEIARLVRSIKDLAAVVRQAEPEDKAGIYRQLGVRLTYDSEKHEVLADETRPALHAKPVGYQYVSEGRHGHYAPALARRTRLVVG